MMSDELKMVEIPEDIIKTEILFRLPNKSLCRFKCVSKHWLSLISRDHNFHLNRVKSRGGHSNKLIFQLRDDTTFHSTDCETLFSEELESPTKFTWNIFCGSCHGLILLMGISGSMDYLTLWNPCIKSYRQITVPSGIPLWEIGMYGLFYDSSLDDYKVVIVFVLEYGYTYSCCCYHQDYNFCYGYSVFSLKSRRWTEIKEFPYIAFDYGKKGVTVNGSLHWIVRTCCCTPSCAIKDRGVIVYYDLLKDEFKELPKPDDLNKVVTADPISLANLGGCLCIFGYGCFDGVRLRLMVWEMKEYGLKESWTLLFHVVPSEFYMRPLCSNEKGEVVMGCYSTLVGALRECCSISDVRVYDIKRKTFKLLKHFDTDGGITVETYIESLVSPTTRYATLKFHPRIMLH